MAELAQRLFETDHARTEAEDAVSDALQAAGINHDDIGWDHYDSSLEILGCEQLTEDQKRVIWQMGFERVWIHPDVKPDKATEKYYAKPVCQ